MPIKGLSDRGLAFPEIGQIRKGAKKQKIKKDGKEIEILGKELPYFRVEFDQNEQESAATFRRIYGDKPESIRILFPFDDIQKVWDPWKEAYTAGRMVARSDGEFIKYQVDEHGEIIVKNWLDSTGAKVPHPADDLAGKDYKGKPIYFKNNGRLKVIIPELKRAAYLTLMTTSTYDIANISDQIAAFHNINGGEIKGIPFILKRVPKEISGPKSDKDKTRVRRLHWMCNIEVDPNWAEAKFSQLNQLAQPEIMPALEAGDYIIEEDPDEAVEFEGMVEEEDEKLPDIELINPLDPKAVKWAAEQWNIDPTKAYEEIGRLGIGKQIDKEEFKGIIKSKA